MQTAVNLLTTTDQVNHNYSYIYWFPGRLPSIVWAEILWRKRVRWVHDSKFTPSKLSGIFVSDGPLSTTSPLSPFHISCFCNTCIPSHEISDCPWVGRKAFFFNCPSHAKGKVRLVGLTPRTRTWNYIKQATLRAILHDGHCGHLWLPDVLTLKCAAGEPCVTSRLVNCTDRNSVLDWIQPLILWGRQMRKLQEGI